MRTVLAVLSAASILGVSCARAAGPSDAGFAGSWVMTLDGKPLMVLTLEPKDGHYVGGLTHPRRMTTDGRTFSGLSNDTLTEQLTSEAPRESTVRMSSIDPSDPNDINTFELTLTSAGEGRFTLVGSSFKPWRVTRHIGTAAPQIGTGWDEKRSYPVEEPYVAPNPEMAEIYKADQAARQSMKSFQANAKQIEKEDAARRLRVRELLAKGELKAGEDFRLAAMVFQHGGEPREYLFAHTLALVALAKGDRGAAWISSASLDRYLNSIGQQQIFGSQFGFDGKSQGAFDRDLISDALRQELGVPALADQQAQMEALLNN